MPRPNKALRRVRLSAISAWKRGEKKEAYTLWEKAAAGKKEHYTKKRANKKQSANTDAETTES